MSAHLDLLRSELDRVGARVRELTTHRDSLAETRAHLKTKIGQLEDGLGGEAADPQMVQKTLSHLRIEDEQTAEHERLVAHQLSERNKRLDDLAEDIGMLQDSSIV